MFTDITFTGDDDNTQTITIGDVGGLVGTEAGSNGGSGTDLIIIGIQCPQTGPVTIAITAIQGTSAKTGSINCRGAAATMESTVRDVTTTGDPKGNVITNIRANGADLGQKAAYVSARAKDSNGKRGRFRDRSLHDFRRRTQERG